MTAQVQAFMQAHPVSSALSRAVRWDQLKVHIQDVARHFSSTLHAERTTQLRALKVCASIARAAYLTDPANQQALQQLRDTAATLQQHRQQQAATTLLETLSACLARLGLGVQSAACFWSLWLAQRSLCVVHC